MSLKLDRLKRVSHQLWPQGQRERGSGQGLDPAPLSAGDPHRPEGRGLPLLNEKGQGLTEYITLLVLISLVAVGAAKSLGKNVRDKIKTAREHINSDINFNDVRSN